MLQRLKVCRIVTSGKVAGFALDLKGDVPIINGFSVNDFAQYVQLHDVGSKEPGCHPSCR